MTAAPRHCLVACGLRLVTVFVCCLLFAAGFLLSAAGCLLSAVGASLHAYFLPGSNTLNTDPRPSPLFTSRRPP